MRAPDGKAGARERARAALAALTSPDRETASRAIGANLARVLLEHRPEARVIAAFHPMASEPQFLAPWWESWPAELARAATVVFPRCLPGGELEWRSARFDPGWADWDPGTKGFPEPKATQPLIDPSRIEFVCVPALAMLPTGGRLGHGEGWYDRALPRVPASAPRWALVFEAQLSPAGGWSEQAHDQRLDGWVTERGGFAARPGRGSPTTE